MRNKLIKKTIMAVAVLIVIGLLAATLSYVFTPKKLTPKEEIEQAFMRYVETDFDNPDDFIEITNIKITDTLDNHYYDKILDSVLRYDRVDGWKVSKFEKYYLMYASTDFRWCLSEIKIRKMKDGEPRIYLYQGIKKDGKFEFQDHLITLSEAPYPFHEMAELAQEILLN